MIDSSETSNPNLEDITKALEDMDSLDMKLFNESFRKSKSSISIAEDSNIQVDGEMKKKVIFKDSNEYNLLTDLLSDDETFIKEKRNSFSIGSKNNLIEDLFKIKTPVASTISIKSNNELESKFDFEQEGNQLFSQNQSNNSISKSTFTILPNESTKERKIEKLKNIDRNKKDILGNIVDKSDVPNNKSGMSSVRENVLEHKSELDSALHKNIRKVEPKSIVQSISNQQEMKSKIIDQSTKLSTKESRGSRRNAEFVNDPLGLLSTTLLPDQVSQMMVNETVPIKGLEIQNTKIEENLPEWLGGSKKSDDKKSKEKKIEVEETPISKKNIETYVSSTTDLNISDTNKLKTSSGIPKHMSMLFGTELNQQTALMNMQQQEHELKTAAVLSQHNEQLNRVSNAQYTLLHNQEEQFNTLLKLQFERQALLEKQIKMQQERIDQYIQVLMAQPASVLSTTSVYASCISESCCKGNECASEKEEMENMIRMLQAEKLKLKDTLSIINERHNDEMAFQAEFYQKQASFSKEIITKLEERTKHEVECLEKDYMTKLEKIRDEKQQLENQYKDEIRNLKNEHAQHVKEICDLHTENIKLLQKEYSNIIESISRIKQTEDEMMETMINRKTDIEDILQKANCIIDTILKNKQKLEIEHNEIIKFREDTLKITEDNIKAQKLDLKTQNDILVEHRNQFIEITEKHNIHLIQLLTELQKQNTLSSQSQEILEKQSANLLRERELFEEKVKWERDYLQTLKESWKKEQEKQLKLFAEETEKVAVEKAQLEVLRKLKSNNDTIVKVELEAAIKIAQEATICANKEKLKWQEKMNELNTYNQFLQDKENLLILRAKELENLTQSVLIKKEEGIKALKDIKYLENQNKDKFNQLQMQLETLMEREKKVVTENYNLTKDGILSLIYEHEKPEKDESLHFADVSFADMQSKPHMSSELMNIDPNLTILKLDVNNEIDSINKYTYRFDN